MSGDGFADEYRQMAEVERQAEELYQQAQDDYEWQLAQVPLRVNYDDDTSYEESLSAWDVITQTLLDHVKELQRTA
jgi:hypothetical protein